MSGAFEGLVAAYSQPQRHYHTLAHIADCLGEFEPIQQTCERPDAVRAALLFHDVVYDPTRSDNEERSAAVADETLRAAGWADVLRQMVRDLVLATKHAAPPATPDAAIVVDVDLAILGKPAEVFDAYEGAIRLEYAHVPDAAFAAGRAKILRHLLDRPTLYATSHFRGRYEQPARQNLARSLERLSR